MVDTLEHAAPAGDALEQAVAKARAQLEAEEAGQSAEPGTTDTPAEPAPDASPKEDAEPTEETESSAPEGTEAKAEETSPEEEKPPSRRQKAKALEEQIAERLEAKYQAHLSDLDKRYEARLQEIEQRVTPATQPISEQGKQVREWAKKVAEGDWESTEALAKWTVEHAIGTDESKPPKFMEDVYKSGRDAAYAEIARDYPKLKGLSGVDDAAYDKLLKAPTIPDLVSASIEIGRQAVQGTIDDKDEEIARLQGTVEQLKGQLASKGTSPEGAGGTKGASGPPAKARNFDDAVRIAAAELGIRSPI